MVGRYKGSEGITIYVSLMVEDPVLYTYLHYTRWKSRQSRGGRYEKGKGGRFTTTGSVGTSGTQFLGGPRELLRYLV